MELLEIHQKIIKHLTEQKAQSLKSYEGGKICAYRGDNGLMCAAGCMIPDELYSEELEDRTIGSIIFMRSVEEVFGFEVKSSDDALKIRDTVAAWQNYHDSNAYALWCKDEGEVSPQAFFDQCGFNTFLEVKQ